MEILWQLVFGNDLVFGILGPLSATNEGCWSMR